MDATVLARTVQYGAVAIVGGSSLLLATTAAPAWPRWLSPAAALIGVAATCGWLAAEAIGIADLSAIGSVATDTSFGRAGLVRVGLLLLAAAVSIVRPSAWTVLAGLGGLAAASFAWTGHGGIGAGVLGAAHLLADIIHLLAATAWIGALPVLALLALDHRDPASAASALRDFSRLGPALVCLILLSGLVNSCVLVGPAAALHLTATPYGRLLAAKLVLFMMMLALAAANRWKLTPALDRAIARSEPSPRALITSLVLETLLGATVIGLVAWMGTVLPAAHA